MNKIFTIAVLLVVVFLVSEGVCGTTVNITPSASVTSILELASTIKKHTDTDGDGTVDTGEPYVTVTSISLGELQRPTNTDGTPGALYATDAFHVFLGANSSSRKYKISYTGSALSNGSVSIPSGAYVCNPAWAGDSNNTDISGDALGATGTAVGTKDVYTSNDSGKSATVEVVFGVPRRKTNGDFQTGQTADVPPDQAGGSYSSSITFTLALR